MQHSVHTRVALGVSTSIATFRVVNRHERTLSLARCTNMAANLRNLFYGSSRRPLETVSASVEICVTRYMGSKVHACTL